MIESKKQVEGDEMTNDNDINQSKEFLNCSENHICSAASRSKIISIKRS